MLSWLNMHQKKIFSVYNSYLFLNVSILCFNSPTIVTLIWTQQTTKNEKVILHDDCCKPKKSLGEKWLFFRVPLADFANFDLTCNFFGVRKNWLFVFQPKPHNIVGTIRVCKLLISTFFAKVGGFFAVVAYFLFNKKNQLFHGLISLNFLVTYRLIYGKCHTSFQSLWNSFMVHGWL